MEFELLLAHGDIKKGDPFVLKVSYIGDGESSVTAWGQATLKISSVIRTREIVLDN